MKTTLTDRAVKSAKADIADAVVPGLILRVSSHHGTDEQMFGAKQQVPHAGSGD